MSPFFVADKIKTPLLLIHGAEDPNPGTFPMQSERLFAALKGARRRGWCSSPRRATGTARARM